MSEKWRGGLLTDNYELLTDFARRAKLKRVLSSVWVEGG